MFRQIIISREPLVTELTNVGSLLFMHGQFVPPQIRCVSKRFSTIVTQQRHNPYEQRKSKDD